MGFCNLWNPTWSRETHEDVLIRSDIPLMCRGVFSPLLYALKKNKTGSDINFKTDNIYIKKLLNKKNQQPKISLQIS